MLPPLFVKLPAALPPLSVALADEAAPLVALPPAEASDEVTDDSAESGALVNKPTAEARDEVIDPGPLVAENTEETWEPRDAVSEPVALLMAEFTTEAAEEGTPWAEAWIESRERRTVRIGLRRYMLEGGGSSV